MMGSAILLLVRKAHPCLCEHTYVLWSVYSYVAVFTELARVTTLFSWEEPALVLLYLSPAALQSALSVALPL